jgi:hypothetical protein
MSPRRAWLLLLAASSLLCSAALAYKREIASGTGKPLVWTSLPMKWNLHQAPAPGVTFAATQTAVRAAYQSWSTVSCSQFRSQDLGVVNLPLGNNSDHINSHVWMTSWPPNYGAQALGITWTQYDPSSGTIVDADTHYNPGYKWSTTGAYDAIDVQSVATHEIGHQLGLDHTSVTEATMFYATGQGDTHQRSLDSDDITGLCAIYPNGTTLPPECTSPAQCAPNETCQNQKCVTVSKKGYGGTCPNGPNECTSGICLGYSGNQFCSQGCDSAACPNGDKCYPVSGGGAVTKACLPGSADMGTKLLGQSCQAPADCKSNVCISVPGKGSICSQTCDVAKNDCPSGYVCTKATVGGVCMPSNEQPPPTTTKKKLGETCSSNSDCATSLCIQVGKDKVCVQLCDKDKSDACAQGFTCYPSGNKGVCLKSGGPTQPTKGLLGTECTKDEECDSNLCAEFNGTRFCTQICNPSDPNLACPDTFDCTPAGENQGACTPQTTNPDQGSGGGCGCLYAAAGRTPTWLVLLFGAVLGLLLRRRWR